eukprot:3328201-Amphidinium_carterae.1
MPNPLWLGYPPLPLPVLPNLLRTYLHWKKKVAIAMSPKPKGAQYAHRPPPPPPAQECATAADTNRPSTAFTLLAWLSDSHSSNSSSGSRPHHSSRHRKACLSDSHSSNGSRRQQVITSHSSSSALSSQTVTVVLNIVTHSTVTLFLSGLEAEASGGAADPGGYNSIKIIAHYIQSHPTHTASEAVQLLAVH